MADPSDLSWWFGGGAPDQSKTRYADADQIHRIINQGFASSNQVAPQAGQTQLAPAAQIAQGPQDQFRRMQMAQANQLQGIASGQQMGAGELAARRAGQQAIAGQHAMANMARGQNAATAGLGAARNIATIGGNVAGQAQQAALSDQQAAQSQLANAINNGRTQDVGLAANQAQLNQQTALQQGQMNQNVALANLQAKLQQSGMNNQQIQAYLSQLSAMDANQLNAATGLASAPNNGILGPLLSAGGQVAGAAIMHSDERLKMNVADARNEIDEMLDALRPKSYDYKDPKHGEGRRAGIMAQDLERSEAGRRIVFEAPDGKALDVNKALSAALAASARLNERVRAIEAKGG